VFFFYMYMSLAPLISCDLVNLAYSRVPRYPDVTAGTLTATNTYALRMHVCGREQRDGRGNKKNKSYPLRRILLQSRVKRAALQVWPIATSMLLTRDMYKSSLRHIHDPVLSSLKMKGIRLLFFTCFAMALVVRRRPCTAETLARYQTGACAICGG
jgi:hypothetical protein